MKLEDVLRIWTPARLAEVTDTSIQNICGWMKEGQVPRSREYELQVKSGGRLHAHNFDPQKDYTAGGLRKGRSRA